MNKIIYFTRFFPITTGGGGGSRRVIQILEIIKKLNFNCEVISSARIDYVDQGTMKRIEENARDLLSLPHNILKKYHLHLWKKKRRVGYYRLSEISQTWSQNFSITNKLNLAFVDDPIYFAPLVTKLKKSKIPIVAICHNLETLAPAQIEDDPYWTLFNREIELLAGSDLVITISREETFLLNNFGVNTMFLPYYPVEPIFNRLLHVREKRKRTKKKGLLLLGNALNMQTLLGMEHVIHHWYETGLQRKEGKLMVAGFKTEQFLKKLCQQYSESTDFLGTLSDKDLDSLLGTIKACLCYQVNGAGALTRICEVLIAGVPVLANSIAARSYYNMKGIIEFPELNGLGEAIKKIDIFKDDFLLPSAPKHSHIIEEIKLIMMN